MRLCTNDGCGFQFVRYKRQFSTDFCSREHAVCPLSGIKKRPFVGGFLYISTIVISIGATASVLYREVVRWWEGPLWEVPLYLSLKLLYSISFPHSLLMIHYCLFSDLSTGRITSIDVNSCDDDFTDVDVRFHGSISAYVVQ